MNCKKCGAEVNTYEKFCGECGSPTEHKIFCGNCGAEISKGEKFCGECGSPVTSRYCEEKSKRFIESKKNFEEKNEMPTSEKEITHLFSSKFKFVAMISCLLLIIFICVSLYANYNNAMQKYEQNLKAYNDKKKAPNAYSSLLKSNEYANSYVLYDFDKDGLKELVLCWSDKSGWDFRSHSRKGKVKMEYQCEVYTYKNGSTKKCGDFYAMPVEKKDENDKMMHYGLYNYSDKFIIALVSEADTKGNTSKYEFKQVNVRNDVVEISDFNDSAFHNSDDGTYYTPHGSDISDYKIDDTSQLNSAITISEPKKPSFFGQ